MPGSSIIYKNYYLCKEPLYIGFAKAPKKYDVTLKLDNNYGKETFICSDCPASAGTGRSRAIRTNESLFTIIVVKF